MSKCKQSKQFSLIILIMSTAFVNKTGGLVRKGEGLSLKFTIKIKGVTRWGLESPITNLSPQ